MINAEPDRRTGGRDASSWTLRVSVQEGEYWWGGAVTDGAAMPFGRDTKMFRDLAVDAGPAAGMGFGGNQSSPLFVSSQGRVIHSESPFAFRFDEGVIYADGDARLFESSAASLQGASRLAASVYRPSGETPAIELFTGTIYNVWMELPFVPTQDGVIEYARRVIDAGLPPGILVIDDNWGSSYGDWTFDPHRFPDPAAMTSELREMGFQVMLWIAPYVTPDTQLFRWLRERDMLLRDAGGELAIREWWNGFGAILDLTNPDTVQWMRERLDALCNDIGIAGFKFDGGDLPDYRPGDGGDAHAPTVQCNAWSELGRRYPFNEFRASWGTSGWPLMQRLADKPAVPFVQGGIDSLIPEGIAQGLTGYPFACPDLIGGGEIGSLGSLGDEEFIVRYTQCAALFPVIQFSVNPARVLGPRALEAVREALRVRSAHLPEILALVENARTTGDPILRPLAFHYPGMELVRDQFLLGEDLLVAPVLERGARERQVALPPGTWRDDRGAEFEGPAVITRPVDLDTLPRYRRM